MTNEQKEQVRLLREKNIGYLAIANALDISVDAVRGYCRRNGLTGQRSNATRNDTSVGCCLECGKPIIQRPGIKQIKFCSSGCRQAWWNAHPDTVNRKAVYEFTCACCGKVFTAYGNASRKYCCHPCYIEGRYGRRAGNE
ncbi:RNA polymerase subunit sigma-70 [Enterocloster clostridioformis]|mgnify:FL=1|uniref:RNA polymerase subunit sigma-70 n=1 Tax=Enterocloster clostridioformis TaxID=1531 RepID=UPI0034A0D1D1